MYNKLICPPYATEFIVDVIEIKAFGNITNDDLYSSLDDINRFYEKNNINKVLVDTTKVDSVPGNLVIYQFIISLKWDIKYALILSENHSAKAGVRFIETVATNRGYRVKIFPSKMDALKWFQG